MTHATQTKILYLRFGSNEDFSTHKMQVNTIGRILRIPPSTVGAVIKRFISNGYEIKSMKYKGGLLNKKQLPEDVIMFLLNLEENAHMSLEQRCLYV